MSEVITADAFRRPLRDLRISVMDRCNFRCPYCMPCETFHENYGFLSADQRLSRAEIVRLASVFARLGVRKLRVTGGEPLLLPGLATLIAGLCAVPGIEDVALTTNGSLLDSQAPQLRAAGLARITVSLDSVDPDVFRRMSGGFGELTAVLAGIERARCLGFAPIKLNAVVQRGVNEHTVLDLVERFRGTGVTVRFIEYMDVGNRNRWSADSVVPTQELIGLIERRWRLRALPAHRVGEVAARYEFVDGAGELGFISSVTQPFCGQCSRARLSSDGVLYTCLFATRGTNLKAALRGGASDTELRALIMGAWQSRSDRYSQLRNHNSRKPTSAAKVEMYYIGG
jgi:GTP 3',8-cyclase